MGTLKVTEDLAEMLRRGGLAAVHSCLWEGVEKAEPDSPGR